jgi:MFS family permease
VVPQFEFAYLDPRRDSFRHGVMGAIRRTINLIIALVLFAMGCGGLAYFYFIAATQNAGTFATSSVLLLVTAYMFGAGLLWAIAQTIAWCIIFFFASAAASSAYLTASEIFPLETRALANACFYAFGTAIGGSTSPLLFGWLIESGSAWHVSFGYAIAALPLLAAGTELRFGVDAEGKPLESIADPLSS